jgi:hypothetical protein
MIAASNLQAYIDGLPAGGKGSRESITHFPFLAGALFAFAIVWARYCHLPSTRRRCTLRLRNLEWHAKCANRD